MSQLSPCGRVTPLGPGPAADRGSWSGRVTRLAKPVNVPELVGPPLFASTIEPASQRVRAPDRRHHRPCNLAPDEIRG